MSAIVLLLMGVSGSGKSTIGAALSRELSWPFYDGDDFHPAENVAKMSRGLPLTDEDRAPWLDRLRALVETHLLEGRSAILGSSALKQTYRERLGLGMPQVRLVYLKGSYELILQRMQARPGHFFQPEMLESQFAALEEPQHAWVVDIDKSPEAIVNEIVRRLEDETGIREAGEDPP